MALKGFEASLPYDYTRVNKSVLRVSLLNEIPESNKLGSIGSQEYRNSSEASQNIVLGSHVLFAYKTYNTSHDLGDSPPSPELSL